MSPPGRERGPAGTGPREVSPGSATTADGTSEPTSLEGWRNLRRYRQEQRDRVALVKEAIEQARHCLDLGMSGATRLDRSIWCADQALRPALAELLKSLLDEDCA